MKRWIAALLVFPAAGLAQPGHDHSRDPLPPGPLAPPGPQRAQQIYDMYEDQIFQRADRFYHNGEYWNMISLLTLRMGIDPDDASTNSDLVFYLRSVERYDLALTQAIRFRSEHKGDELAVEPEAQIYQVQKLWNRIPGILEPYVATTHNLSVFIMLMKAYEEMGLVKEAIRVVEKRLERFPNDGAAKQNLNRLQAKLQGR